MGRQRWSLSGGRGRRQVKARTWTLFAESKAREQASVEAQLIQARDITKTYHMGQVQVYALRGVSLQIGRGEMVAVMGASGSGKSTLMNILGCLDRPTSGTYLLDGQDTSRLRDDQLAEIRNRKIGFVFQTFNLLPRTSALQNVMLPLIYTGTGRAERRERAQRALEAVGLGDRVRHAPNELSGGQQQRVAIARALVTEPAILLADEPTGNLDSTSGAEVMALLQALNREQRITLVLVTHDPEITGYTQRVIHLHDGSISGIAAGPPRRESAIEQPHPQDPPS
jgi:putative ABC transport system ATP-binding protein